MSAELAQYQTGRDPRQARMIEEMSHLIAEGFPVAGLDLIPVKDKKTGQENLKLYINNLGLTWLCQRDDRGVAEMDSECIIDALIHDKGYAKYRATIRFKDGSRYTSEGSAQPDNTKARWEVNEIAETRAFNRAMRRATAQTLLPHNLDIYEPEPRIELREVDEMKLEEANLTDADALEQIQNMDDLENHVVSIVSTESWPRKDRDGMTQVLNIEYDGQISRRWCPGPGIWLAVQSFFRQHPGQTLECRFVKYETRDSKGKEFFKWRMAGVGEVEEGDIPF